MKKQSLLLITGGILAFASCNTDTAATNDNSQAKIDSMVNERVEMIRAELEAKNDSLINDMAMYRADSIMAAMSGKKAPVRKPATKPVTEEVTSEKPKSTNPKDSRFGGEKDNTTKKESRFNEDAAEKQKEAGQNKKADRFNK